MGKPLLLPNPLTNNPQPCHAVIPDWAKDWNVFPGFPKPYYGCFISSFLETKPIH